MGSSLPKGVWTGAQVTSDGNDISIPLQGPLLGTTDQPNKHKPWRKILLLLLTLVVVTCIALALGLTLTVTPDRPIPELVTSDKAVVTCDDARCSKVGISMLKKGGNAVDAAIATALCLGVVNPTESGIGGGAFIVVHNATTSKTTAFDAREVAPLDAHEYMYVDNPGAQAEGPLSVAVPGELAGLEAAWKEHGSLPWSTLFEPAINYANNGFEVFPYLAVYIEVYADKILGDPGKREVFAPNGVILTKGETCYNKKLGKSLEAVASGGADAFYNGTVGQLFVNDVRLGDGILRNEDLMGYKAIKREVLEVDVMGYKIQGMPVPSGGLVGVAMVANVLKNYGSVDALKGPLGLHRLTEAIKHMLGMRMNLGDPDFDDVTDYVYNMTSSPSFAEEIYRKIIDTRTFPLEYYTGSWNKLEHHGTSHIGVIDGQRNAVGLTASINDHFGGKLMSPSTGILINNEMGDFSVPQSEGSPSPAPASILGDISIPPSAGISSPHANRIEPGKRPLSSMTPLILFKDGQLAAVIGGSGGMNIIAAVAQVFLNHFALGKTPLEAVETPRVFPWLFPNVLNYENMTAISGKHIEVPEEDRDFLKDTGHELSTLGFFPVVCHLIVQTFEEAIDLGRKNGRTSADAVRFGKLTAVADVRKDAKPAGL